MDRPLFLNGFMATGKSTVGRLAAARLGVPFVDLDAAVEARAGCRVAEIFATKGESGFRQLEREELGRWLDTREPAVVALGGGALLAREPRLAALRRGYVVTLEATPATVLARNGGKAARPLLAVPNPDRQVAELLAQRRASYAEAHARLQTDERSPQAIAEEVVEVVRRRPIAVAAGESSYSVEVGEGLCAARLGALARGASRVLLVTDSNVGPLHAATAIAALERAQLTADVVRLDAGEEHKTLAAPQRIWEAALAQGVDRSGRMVALGGGVVTDITGFAAASWMRGIGWVGVPTTLLAMVDASVGGKTGVDLGPAKNAVGAFWQPRGVLCDISLLATEPDRGFVSALAEVVKTALIGDPELFLLLEKDPAAVLRRDPSVVADVVSRCIQVKADVVSRDERESGLRATLNLGHTVGHALEAQAGYSRLTHGEAISLGLVAACRLGERIGRTPPELSERVVRLLRTLGLPVELAKEPLADAARLIGHDKKRAGKSIRFVVARALGDVTTVDLPLAEVRELTPALR